MIPLAVRAQLSQERLLLAGLSCLSLGTIYAVGFYRPPALGLVLLAVVLIAMASRAHGSPTRRFVWAVATLAIAAGNLRYARRLGLATELPLAGAVVYATVGAVLVRVSKLRLLLLVAAGSGVVAMTAVAWHWGSADIDVFYLVQRASALLLHGLNPYAAPIAHPTALDPDHTAIAFTYLPGVSLLAAPGYLLGDVRVMSVVAFLALTLIAWQLAGASGASSARIAATVAVCIATPTTVAMVHWAWVDVYAVLGLAGWITWRVSHRPWAIVMLFLGLTIKPTILIALVPAFVWSARARLEIVVAVVLAIMFMLPFIIATGATEFFHDVIGIEASIGFRPLGLTLSAFFHQFTGHLVPVVVSALCGVAIGVFALWKRPETLTDMLISAALLSTAALLLAQWAFLNYYFIPIWLLAMAFAARGIGFDSATQPRLPDLLASLARRSQMPRDIVPRRDPKTLPN